MSAAADGDETVPLADLPPGATGEVASLDERGPLGRRLFDLGFVPQTPVRVVRRAPLGDPVVYALRGTNLCLRRVDAERIRVRRVDAERIRVRRS